MRRRGLLLVLAALAACGDAPAPKAAPPVRASEPPPATPEPDGGEREEPRWVRYDHILITFRGAYKAIHGDRTRAEAEAFANGLYRRIRDGLVSWEAAKREYSDDRGEGHGQALGPYLMVNFGVRRTEPDQIPRDVAEPGLAKVVFALDVGEVGLAPYDPRACKWGWHIVKRLP
jgi:hypothetical protein